MLRQGRKLPSLQLLWLEVLQHRLQSQHTKSYEEQTRMKPLLRAVKTVRKNTIIDSSHQAFSKAIMVRTLGSFKTILPKAHPGQKRQTFQLQKRRPNIFKKHNVPSSSESTAVLVRNAIAWSKHPTNKWIRFTEAPEIEWGTPLHAWTATRSIAKEKYVRNSAKVLAVDPQPHTQPRENYIMLVLYTRL